MRQHGWTLPTGLRRVLQEVVCGIDTGHAIRLGLRQDSRAIASDAPVSDPDGEVLQEHPGLG